MLKPNDHLSVCSPSPYLGSQVSAIIDKVAISFDSALPYKTEASSSFCQWIASVAASVDYCCFQVRARSCEGAAGDDGLQLLSLRMRRLDQPSDRCLATWAGVRVVRECSKRKSFAAAA